MTLETKLNQDKKSAFGKSNGKFFQAKLTVNTPGDKHEQEAEKISDQISKSPKVNSASFFKPQITPLKHNSPDGRTLTVPNTLKNKLENDPIGGDNLSEDVRTSMEKSFRADFRNVKIHHDSEAEEANHILNANAFTYGNHIYFNSGKFNPKSEKGGRLLAHELTHVVQQGAANSMAVQRDEESSETENEAESPFEFDFNMLPPSIQFSLGQWMLEANTSQVALQFSQGLLRSRFGYNYGGDLFMGTQSPGSSAQLGFNPSTTELSFNLTEDRFRFGSSLNLESGGFGLNLGYGARLLPMPFDLASPVYGGWGGASGILGDIGNMQDPISFYQAHGDNIDSIMGAVRALRPLADESYQGFGAGLRFSYNPTTGVLIHGGLQWMF